MALIETLFRMLVQATIYRAMLPLRSPCAAPLAEREIWIHVFLEVFAETSMPGHTGVKVAQTGLGSHRVVPNCL
jgi:hypothetical protein